MMVSFDSPRKFARWSVCLVPMLLLAPGVPALASYTLGTDEGMPLFPAPIPGHPGADPKAGRRLWAKPQRVNYPGSIEHYRVNKQNYINPINPYNHRSLIANFIAVELPGVSASAKEQFAEPVQFVWKGNSEPVTRTGEFREPVSVVRLKPGGERLSFSLPRQEVGLYAIRVVAALETKDARENEVPLGLVLEVKVNDGPNGEVNRYILRERGTDNFYALGEVFFRANDAREWRVEVGLHVDSKVDLLVHNVDVHDVFAELPKRGGKKESILTSDDQLRDAWGVDVQEWMGYAKEGRWEQWYAEVARKLEEEVAQEGREKQFEHLKTIQSRLAARIKELQKRFPDRSPEELRAMALPGGEADAVAWESLPPINLNYAFADARPLIAPPQTEWDRMIAEGGWDPAASSGAKGWVIRKPWALEKREGDQVIRYTAEQLAAHEAFPGYNFPVHSWGVEMTGADGERTFFNPLGRAIGTSYREAISKGGKPQTFSEFLDMGDLDSAHFNALEFCRLVYDLPTLSVGHSLAPVLMPSGRFYNWVIAHQHRHQDPQLRDLRSLSSTYDRIFPFIKGNQALANSVGKWVPWVKTPEDLIKLIDTHLLQYAAKEAAYFRFYYNHEHAAIIMQIAAIQGDPEMIAPWMWVLFNQTWEYPLDTRDLRTLIYQATQRDGTTTIGSSFYTMGGNTYSRMAPWMQAYMAQGGDSKYNLLDDERYSRLMLGSYFAIESRVAGGHSLGVGDVGSPSVGYKRWMDQLPEIAMRGWKVTKDPVFAYVLKHYSHPQTKFFLSRMEEEELDAAAKQVQRDPFFAMRSRVLSDWGGILEGGTDSDDFRHRHAVRLRVGRGFGHAHQDLFDLGIWSMGLVMTGDGAARPGYAQPDSSRSLVHNVATLNGEFGGHGWISDLSDFGGPQYLRAKRLGNGIRQVGLIEVDAGTPGPDSNTEGVVPRAYVVDFFRLQKGAAHAFHFHGPPHDRFDVNLTPASTLTQEDEQMLSAYIVPGEQWAAAVTVDPLQVTWQMQRENRTFTTKDGKVVSSRAPAEEEILGALYNEKAPLRYLRVHVPGEEGRSRFLTGLWLNTQQGHFFQNAHLMRQQDSKEEGALFAAVWEPYSGVPTLKSVRLSRFPTEEDLPEDRQPAALWIETELGHRDVVYASMGYEQVSEIGEGITLAGQFAYISRDSAGWREVSMTEAERLLTPDFDVEFEFPEWKANFLSVDPLKRLATLDVNWPEGLLDGSFYELQSHNGYVTTFEALKILPSAEGSVLQWRKGIDEGTGLIESVEWGQWKEEETSFVVKAGGGYGQTRFVRLEGEAALYPVVNRGSHGLFFVGSGGMDAEAFSPGKRLNGFVAGPGSSIRIPNRFSLKRVAPSVYQVGATAPFSMRLKGRAEWSLDGKSWQALPRIGESTSLKADLELLRKGPLFVRWNR